MTAAKALFLPARLTALICSFAVTSLFAASGAIGWYYVWASRRIEPYKSEGHRAVIIAGVQGGLCALVVFESAYGFISLLSNRKGLIRWYLWLSWITFFIGLTATAGTAVLIWVFRFGVSDCTTNSSRQITCKDLPLVIKIVLSVVASLGCWVQSYMPKVLRLVYSRFSVHDALPVKQDPEDQPPLPDHDESIVSMQDRASFVSDRDSMDVVGHEYSMSIRDSIIKETPEMVAYHLVDQPTRRPAFGA